jgi:periplasmic copper chaperone A
LTNRSIVAAGIAGVMALALVLAPAAFAHVTVQPNEAAAGQFTRLDVRVPNEQDDKATTKVVVQFPDGFAFVSYEPVPGWKTSVKMEKAPTPIESEGETATEQVGQVTWTGSGADGKIGPGQFQDFGLSAQIPDKPNTTLTFKALQTYEGGEVVRWIGAPDSEEPAPQVKVVAGGEEHGAASDTEQTSSSSDDDDEDDDVLPIIAIVVGGLGLLMGGFALLRSRRRA